jgi:hypothetical protein
MCFSGIAGWFGGVLGPMFAVVQLSAMLSARRMTDARASPAMFEVELLGKDRGALLATSTGASLLK